MYILALFLFTAVAECNGSVNDLLEVLISGKQIPSCFSYLKNDSLYYLR